MIQDKPQKIKLLTILDLLQRETDEQHPVSRQDLCKRLNDMGISSNPRVLSLDIGLLNDAGYEIMEIQVGREKLYYVEDRHNKNLFCLPRQERFFRAIWAKNRGVIAKSGIFSIISGFRAAFRLFRSPFFLFSGQKFQCTFLRFLRCKEH